MGATELMAPLLVLTTLVERIMEVVWSAWERFKVLAVETLIRQGKDQAEKDKLARDPDYVRKKLLDAADYTERKRLLTLVVGSLLGMGLSIITGVHFFEMTFAVLQIAQPTWILGRTDWVPVVDVLVTGLIIGAGSHPAHSIINWLAFAQNVQKEIGELRKGERTLADLQLLGEAFSLLGVPRETMTDVLKLMERNGVSTLDDLLSLMRSPGAAVSSGEIASAENLKAVKDYLLMMERPNLARMVP